MTVTLAAGHLKPFDIGKWISVDEGGFWVTRKVISFSAARNRRKEPYIFMTFKTGPESVVDRTLDWFDYIQITAGTADGTMPPHLQGQRPVDPRIKHGDLDPATTD